VVRKSVFDQQAIRALRPIYG